MTPPLIPSSVITQLQAVDERAMPDTATITTVTTTRNSATGAYTETRSSTTAPCRFSTATGDEAGDEQIRARGRHRLNLPLGTSVPQTADIIVRGQAYAVKYVWPLTAYSTSVRVGIEETARVAVAVAPGDTIPAGSWIGIGRIPTYAEEVAI